MGNGEWDYCNGSALSSHTPAGAADMHMHIPACIAVGVVFRVVVVARVVAQPAADARSRRTHSISCAHSSYARTPIWSQESGGLISKVWDLGGIYDPEVWDMGFWDLEWDLE